jgi:competence protein ComEA
LACGAILPAPKAEAIAVPEVEAEVVNLNNATSEQLEALPEVGPATAKKLIAGRPYKTITQARKVSGLSDEKWSNVVSLVIV